MIPGEPPSSWQRPPRRGLTLTLRNPLFQPFKLAAVAITGLLVGMGTLPAYVLVLVICATVHLHYWGDKS